jgi:hypothetical protein
MIFRFFFFISFFIEFYLSAQNIFPQKYFSLPISKECKISSNFGEIRPAHFHAGLDFGTKGKVGVPIYAVADGYVSRVKVSSIGYGNALYVTHPNGYVSVYAHLNEFGHAVSEFVYQFQHQNQIFEIDEFLYPNKYKVKKGQVIGKSGNTGRSYGAHLHFEIRDELSEEPINPLFFGLKFPDTEPPRIERLYIYSFAEGMERYRYTYYDEIKKPGIDTVKVFGTIGFGVEIHDYMIKKKKERFGVYQIKMLIDDSVHFTSQMDRISFDDSKYLNSFADYYIYREKGLKVSKCFVEPNNKLKVYKMQGNGLFDFSDGELHKIEIIGEDINGNSGNLIFYLQSDPTAKINIPLVSKAVVKDIKCNQPNEYKTDSFRIFFPENSLYHDIQFRYTKSKVGSKSYSDYHHIHNQNVPLHNKPTISIKPYQIPLNLKEKALIVGIGRNQRLFSVEGIWNGDFIEAEIGYFGSYYVTLDTISPKIVPISLKKSNVLESDYIQFYITDNLSGIVDFGAYIDDKWVLFEYDEKNDLFTCHLPSEFIDPGEHELVLWAKDKVGNVDTFESKFIY